jgi:hypothetical protein
MSALGGKRTLGELPFLMGSVDRSDFKLRSMPSGVGCLLVFPAALFGTAMLADYAGPQGWRGLAEFVGWWTVCIGASVGCEALFSRFRERGAGRYWFLLASVVVAAGLLVFTVVESQPNTPLRAKLIYTTGLQLVGVGGAIATMYFLAWVSMKSRRS